MTEYILMQYNIDEEPNMVNAFAVKLGPNGTLRVIPMDSALAVDIYEGITNEKLWKEKGEDNA